jgi:hypothetical protein
MIRKSHLLIIDKQELLPKLGTNENGSEGRQAGRLDTMVCTANS